MDGSGALKDNLSKNLTERYGNDSLIEDLKLVRATRKFMDYTVKVKVEDSEKIHYITTLTEEGGNDIILFDWELTKEGKAREEYYREFGEFVSRAFD